MSGGFRSALSGFGVWTNLSTIGAENAAAAAALTEQLGFTAFWLGGSPRLPQLRPLLEGSERLLVGTSVVNIWGYEPDQVAAECSELERDFPGRVMLGIGVGHREADAGYVRPLSSMEAFLDDLDRARQPLPAARRCLAALGPKMQHLARERSAGSIPYFTSVEHTTASRAVLGPDRILAPELSCVVDDNAVRAAATASAFADRFLRLANYRRALSEHGHPQENVAGGASRRLVAAVVPHAGVEAIARVAEAHRDAGADHVSLQVVVGEGQVPRHQWSALAARLCA